MRHSFGIELLPFFLAALYVVLTPFAKVEESFHLQATHDILVHGADIAAYDHHEFPGVVPRTFLGALYLAVVSWPWAVLTRAVGAPKIFLQMAVRLMLAASVCGSYARLLAAVSRRLGRRTAVAMSLTVASTPHFLFYASRTLPNTFATLLVLHGITEWMLMELEATPADAARWSPRRLVHTIAFFVAAVIWVRGDMLVLLGSVALAWLATGRATFAQLLFNGAIIGSAALAITVAVDSAFWRRLLWPEGVVLLFNVVDNRSHEYGVSPWHWYFTSALPRALLGMAVFIPLGLFTMSPGAKTQPVRESAARAGSSTPTASTGEGGSSSARRASARRAAAVKAVATGADDSSSSNSSGAPSPLPPFASDADALEALFWAHNPPSTLLALLARLRPDWDVLTYTLPGLLFVGLYSFLPHKELRFLLPGMPLLHVAAGRGLTKAFRFGEALVFGLGGVKPAPEVRAAELVADSVESLVDAAAPAAVAAVLGSPRAELRRRRQPLQQPVDVAATSPAPAAASEGSPSPTAAARKRGAAQLSVIRRLLGVAVLTAVAGAVLFSAGLTAVFVRVSMDNYPGGVALQRLYSLYAHDLVHPTGRARLQLALRAGGADGPLPCPHGDVTAAPSVLEWWRQCADAKSGCPGVAPTAIAPPPRGACVPPSDAAARRLTVHIDVASAESGVSRFGQSWSHAWAFNKSESLASPADYAGFDFLLTENAAAHSHDFDVWETVPSFVRVDWRSLSLVRKPRLFIMRRKPEPARRTAAAGAQPPQH